MFKPRKIDEPRASTNPDKIEIPLTERTFQRQRGCWNCRAFDTGEKASQFYATTRINNMRALRLKGCTPQAAEHRLRMIDAAVQPPRTGICLVDGARAPLIFPEFMCSKWTGREKVEGKMDDLPEELWDRLGESLADKPGGK